MRELTFLMNVIISFILRDRRVRRSRSPKARVAASPENADGSVRFLRLGETRFASSALSLSPTPVHHLAIPRFILYSRGCASKHARDS